MATYEIWYSEIGTYRAWIDAENEEDLERKLVEVREGKYHLDELTNDSASCKSWDYEIDYSSVREVKS